METILFDRPDIFNRLLALARIVVQTGRTSAADELACMLRRYGLDLRQVARLLKATLKREQRCYEKKQARKQRQIDRLECSTFAKPHPLFRKPGRKKKKSSDAMSRAILCGGFETNRSRH